MRNFINKLKEGPLEFDLRKYRPILAKIKDREMNSKTDAELRQLSSALQKAAISGAAPEYLTADAFALVCEAARRTIGLSPFDVQIIAGIALHERKLVEMQTGEGKTLAAVLPAYLNALYGRGVHIQTFNDYLARRDAAWMGPIYQFLGLRVGCIQEGDTPAVRKHAYAADVTYMTAKEAGFDFLRDQLCYSIAEQVHRRFDFVIIDEADSLLIDEARVPLVIAGKTGQNESRDQDLAELVGSLEKGIDFEIDSGKRNVFLTDLGLQKVESCLGRGSLHTQENLFYLTKINLALHAEELLERDKDYIVRGGKIEIVDEFTGRVVEDRHWPDGLQAALEVKEGLSLQHKGTVLGTITLQNFFEHYPKVSGMTATAQSAADELREFYSLDTVVIPPNRTCIRQDHPDVVFLDKAGKTRALIKEIVRSHNTGRPVLVGTASVRESEELAAELHGAGIKCRVLNAKNDELEAGIIAGAGAPGALTISTNMAGRGTDIKLGGDKEQKKAEVISLGGLYVIGTNRHESIRIDRQLRGRAGRQGDPGSSRFYISLEDDLITRYRIDNLIPQALLRTDEKGMLDSDMINPMIDRGQRIIEGENFEIRKTLAKYSGQVEHDRKKLQNLRQELLAGTKIPDVLQHLAPERYSQVQTRIGEKKLWEWEKHLTLFFIDQYWREHLALIADVRESIHLVSVGGDSPLNEFQRIIAEAYRDLEKKLDKSVAAKFNSLDPDESGFDPNAEGLRGPSSTWTYLINDNQFGNWVQLLQLSNIGFAAGAALHGPLYIIWLFLRRLKNRLKK